MFSTLYGTYFLFEMHFRISSAICFNLDKSKILSSVNGLMSLQNMSIHITLHIDLGQNFMLSVSFLYVNLLPDDKILDWFKLKEIADDIAGKRENAGHQHFHLLLQCFLPYQNRKLHLICRMQMLSIWTQLIFFV